MAADLDLAVVAVERLGSGWKLDRWSELTALADRHVSAALRQHRQDPVGLLDAVHAARQLADDAAGQRNYPAATEILDMLATAARRARHADLVRELVTVQKELQRQQQFYQHVQRARVVLETYPNDPSANETLGRWQALYEGDWPAALPHLAQAANPTWREAAKQDQAQPDPPHPHQATQIADHWWELAKKEMGPKLAIR